jgi:hypothetical protein
MTKEPLLETLANDAAIIVKDCCGLGKYVIQKYVLPYFGNKTIIKEKEAKSTFPTSN